MEKHNVQRLSDHDADGTLVGILTRRDLRFLETGDSQSRR